MIIEKHFYDEEDWETIGEDMEPRIRYKVIVLVNDGVPQSATICADYAVEPMAEALGKSGLFPPTVHILDAHCHWSAIVIHYPTMDGDREDHR